MKKFFTKLLLVAMFSTTPFVFTSCGDILGMLDDIMQGIEEEEDGNDDNYYENGGEENAPEENVPVAVENELISFSPSGVSGVNLLEWCVKLTHEYKYTINGLEDCEWARVEWRQGYEGNDWTPLLTVDENVSDNYRQVEFDIFLGENHICRHTIQQMPY